MPPRQTNQRAAVREAIEAADRPLTPQEILDLAQADLPGLGIATVYRAVKVGAEEGWLTPVELPNGPTRYEPAGKKHHHHFECTECNAVFEIDGCPTPPSKLRPMVPEGCELTGHEVILYGRCADCR
ncbi:Fur family transcriptional regulator [Algisphaera agarilytica]|uniref:Fur family ferric uptake transcriptional regulator n=1 Tax=Algisphaera agarilytica TaxID=1385975 RepID=A0A7X0H865_9BACT|nr:transcriptional repressor [Algisphaera agarilytica]MBB6429891.1 Fur family ferric uptake transcriptional regulator [Algisphaera agarilytica]